MATQTRARILEHRDHQPDHAARRQALAAELGDDGIALIAAAPERIRNNDVDYPYRQDSDFRYLTGFLEPQAIAVIAPGHVDGDYILFCRERDPAMEVWNGRRAGLEGACARYGADAAYAIDSFEQRLPELLAGRRRLFLPLQAQPAFRDELLPQLADLPRQASGVTFPDELVALDAWLHDRRQCKGLEELALMREAAATSARAHCAAMGAVTPGMMEYQLAARLHYEFECDGMTWAYATIVGGGDNACILHYTENEAPLADGDLVMIDAGAEYRGYAGDISRTFPVNGRFSAPQRELYDIVLAANRAGIDAAVAGAAIKAPHEAALRVLVTGLVDLGLLAGDVDALIDNDAYRRFFMHGTSHWLGMDVHDVGPYRLGDEWRTLAPGMTLTVEPGLYMPADDDVPARYRGIGIRVEDNVCVTTGAPEVLTHAVPKAADAIEALMREART